MKLERVILQNFRGFTGRVEISISKITTLVGRNDAGKSSVLDALGVFFENPLCKLDWKDVSIEPDESGEMRIGCVFSALPESIILDAAVETTFAEEYLINTDGMLEVHKVWAIGDSRLGKVKTVVIANHPTSEGFSDLLQAKRPALQKQAKNLGVLDQVNQNSNPSLRRVIWGACPDLRLGVSEIQVDKEDAKAIGDQLVKHFPTYALFRADRPSTDEDAEIQDPLRVAIQQAVADLDEDFEKIKEKVRARALDVAQRTLTKLNDFDRTLAQTLEPNFSKALKWDSVFKLSLDGDDGIAINKRGSGVRRLVLFSFFRAEVERLLENQAKANIIYAVEEPETAQHPSSQQKVIEALASIAETDGCQVILTTHVPGLAGLAPVDGIRHVKKTGKRTREVLPATTNETLEEIARELGILPDKRARVIVCVEGPTDIHFFRRISRLFHAHDKTLPDLENDPRVAIVLLGGSTLNQWVNDHLLRNIGLPEVHIYDSDLPNALGKLKYQAAAENVNARNDGSIAFLTKKREIENYLHADAIQETFANYTAVPVTISITDVCDVEAEIKAILGGQGKVNRRSIKNWLNEDAADKMTLERLAHRNGRDEIETWLRAIAEKIN